MDLIDKNCEWKEDDDGIYETSCGYQFYFDDNSLISENSFVFCPFCGCWITEYRILQKDEIIQLSDEVDNSYSWNSECKWVPVNFTSIGKPVSDPMYPAHSIYRRRMK